MRPVSAIISHKRMVPLMRNYKCETILLTFDDTGHVHDCQTGQDGGPQWITQVNSLHTIMKVTVGMEGIGQKFVYILFNS